jgi:hypothetical protein
MEMKFEFKHVQTILNIHGVFKLSDPRGLSARADWSRFSSELEKDVYAKVMTRDWSDYIPEDRDTKIEIVQVKPDVNRFFFYRTDSNVIVAPFEVAVEYRVVES